MDMIWTPAIMHNFSNRINAVVTYASMIIFILIGFNMITGLNSLEEPTVDLKLNSVDRLIQNRRTGDDVAFVTFDLNADLRPAWTWNTKLFFVYVSVEYVTDNNVVNQRVIWDKLIRTKEDALLNLTNQRYKYNFEDQGNGLIGNKNVTLTLNWNYLPLSGILFRENRGQHKMAFPDAYTS
mmetsp:Transcript_29151/g.32375  ORF Transcript_29151/g.32375 Transcript_29151/m.32375 type:complete len:181 (-) Transcript_29151:82-624(-)